jgi:protein TonB
MPRGYAPRRKPRWGLLLLVGLFHLAAFAGLLRAFAPDLSQAVLDRATSLITVTVTAPPDPPPAPEPEIAPQPAPADEGAAGAEAPEAVAREVAAPPVPLPRPSVAPRAASTGTANQSGAGDRGAGTGAGGPGDGTGSGRAGQGQGGQPVTRPEKIAGDINDARDYPVPPGGREARRGSQVIVHMTVGTDGRARDCRVVEPSRDPEADRITCRLAEDRFRFRPATDAAGKPVEAVYGWRQRWF